MRRIPTAPSFFLTACLGALALLLGGCPRPAGGGGAGASGGPSIDVSMTRTGGTGSPIAKVAGSVLTTGDLESRLNQQSPFVRARYASAEKKREFLDNQVRFEVLAAEAMRRGLHKDPEVQDAVKKIIVQKLTREEFDGRVKLADVSEEEMNRYYQEHLDDYVKPEMVRASLIRVAFGPDKGKAEARAKEAQTKASSPATLEDRKVFKKLVAEYSDDETTKRTAGDVRYLSAEEYAQKFGPAVKDAVWGLEKINDVTAVVEGKDGYYVAKKTGLRKPITRTFDQVKNQIRNLIYREKRTEAFNSFVEKLKLDFKVEVYADKLAEVKVDTSASGTPPPASMMDAHPPGLGGEGGGHPGSTPRPRQP